MENSGEKNWKLKLAVCDDEKLFCDEIFKRLKQLRPEYDIDVFTSGVELLACEKEYDIIFLDIQMPEKDGIEVGISLRERKVESKIIYMTLNITLAYVVHLLQKMLWKKA